MSDCQHEWVSYATTCPDCGLNAKEYIEELERQIVHAKIATIEMLNDNAKGDFKLCRLAMLDLLSIASQLGIDVNNHLAALGAIEDDGIL